MQIEVSLPKEHGLIVVWFNTLIISVFVEKSFPLYGALTLLIMATTFFIYDPILVVLRLFKAGRNPLGTLLRKYPYVILFSGIILIWVLYGYARGMLPGISVAVFIFSLLLFLGFFWLGERKIYTRAISILTLTSFFLIISGAFTTRLTLKSIDIFVILSAVEIFLAAIPVEIVNSRIHKFRFNALLFRSLFPIYVIVLLALYILLIKNLTEFLFFFAITTAAFLSVPILRSMTLKRIGLVATLFNIILLAFLLLFYFKSI
ncbi:hypothetical protein [Thermoplasma volcanium GSS1]|uniref:Uncharacterized protein n=1 Tax=Thermoplasma volcanium (strain ATCC 51530 / DSM 4299 / JCM 9571 / NBRC 15438 / GSS1) TaxID=273116 RepID=Q97C20_THEVO|nr:hypothetical protein [Thermoplasma volcanium]BAB59427.1 hypothetical protein [Thermoplasma volcanium GSS1]